MAAAERMAVKDLSSWSQDQEKLIRKALLEYKERSPRKGGLSWHDIQRDVENVTGVSMGGKDHFRQYIGGARAATDVPERRQAIVEFLTDPDVDLLSLKEFLEPGSYLHAPRRLLEYLNTDLDPVEVESPVGRLCGLYLSEAKSSSRRSRIVLELTRVADHDWIMRVTETYDLVHMFKHKNQSQRSELHATSSGWCVLTPEDNLLFFLKEDRYGQNHYYHLVSDMEVWTDEPSANFVLLRYDYPEPLENTSDNMKNGGLALSAKSAAADAFIEFKRLKNVERHSSAKV